MAFIFVESSRARQKYGKLGPGPIVAASEVRILSAKTGELIRVENKNGRRIHRKLEKVDGHDADNGN